MSEHGFLAAVLAFVAVLGVVQGLALGYLTYRVYRMSERIEAVGAATFLEVRRVLGDRRG